MKAYVQKTDESWDVVDWHSDELIGSYPTREEAVTIAKEYGELVKIEE